MVPSGASAGEESHPRFPNCSVHEFVAPDCARQMDCAPKRKIQTVKIIFCGSFICAPVNPQTARTAISIRANLQPTPPATTLRVPMEKVVIIGSGCAGWTAALYTARANLKPVVFTGIQPGGLLTTTSIVENFPGFPEGVDGYELMTRMQKQAERFGAKASFGTVEKVDLSQRPFVLT